MVSTFRFSSFTEYLFSAGRLSCHRLDGYVLASHFRGLYSISGTTFAELVYDIRSGFSLQYFNINLPIITQRFSILIKITPNKKVKSFYM